MKLLAFDLGSHKTGWALGQPGCPRPTISVWRVRRLGQTREEAVADFSRRLRDLLDLETSVEKIAVEKYLDPMAQPETEQVISSLLMHGALRGVAAGYDIPVYEETVAKIRVHFIGRPTAVPARRRGAPPKSKRQVRIDREATKDLVWKQAVTLGYFERGETPSWDKSDAVAVWDWAAATLCRAPRPFAFDPPRVSR